MQPSEDERVLAALAHASIVANVVNLAGMIATALIWTTQRDRSAYVRAHAIQALVYQGAVLLISIVLTLFWGVCLALSLLPVAIRPDLYRSSPPNSFWLALVGLAVPVGFGIAVTAYGLYGAYQTYRGRPFFYPLAGRLARHISVGPPVVPAPVAAPPLTAAEASPAQPAAAVVEPPAPAQPAAATAPPIVEPPVMAEPVAPPTGGRRRAKSPAASQQSRETPPDEEA